MTLSIGSSTIRAVDVQLFHIPLAEVLVDAKHGDHHLFELVVVSITTDDGVTGVGYSYTGGKGGMAIAAMIETDFAPMLIGKNAADIDHLYDEMFWHIHYVGRGGISAFAISAVDIALWDIKGKMSNRTLAEMVGGRNTSCNAYCGGIDLNFPLPKLLDSISSYLERGCNAVKIKVGQPELKTDIKRVAAVRDLIGSDITFMVDANYSMEVDQAIEAARAFKEFDILWFEEPIIPDNYAGYRHIAEASGMDLAMGENLHMSYEFGFAFEDANISYIQPDSSNCGGITGFLRVAEMAKSYHVPVCSHGMQELHVNLLSGLGSEGWLEIHSFPIEDYTTQPLRIENARACITTTAGTGVVFDFDKLHGANLRPSSQWRII